MASLESFLLNREVASSKAIQRIDDKSIALKIRCKGSVGSGTVTVTNTTMVLIDNATTSTTITLATTASTIGPLVTYINAMTNWEAVAVDALSTQSVAAATALLESTVTAATGTDGINVYWDTSTQKYYSLSMQKADLPSKTYTESNYINKAYLINYINTNSSSTNTLTIYKDVAGSNPEAIWTETLTATNTIQKPSVDFSVELLGIDAGKGGRLITQVAVQTVGGGTLQVLGKSFQVEPVA
jgi:hypothetical protein